MSSPAPAHRWSIPSPRSWPDGPPGPYPGRRASGSPAVFCHGPGGPPLHGAGRATAAILEKNAPDRPIDCPWRIIDGTDDHDRETPRLKPGRLPLRGTPEAAARRPATGPGPIRVLHPVKSRGGRSGNKASFWCQIFPTSDITRMEEFLRNPVPVTVRTRLSSANDLHPRQNRHPIPPTTVSSSASIRNFCRRQGLKRH